MKIAHIITSLKTGGAETTLCNLLEYWYNNKNLTDNQHLVIYFYNGPNVSRIKKLGIPIFQIKGFFSPYDPLAFYKLRRLITKIKPDLIHSALRSANIISRLCLLTFTKKIPLICDLHDHHKYHGFIRNLLEKVTISIPTKIIAVSYEIQKSFTKTFKVSSRISVIQNGIDAKKLREKASLNPLTRKDCGFSENDFIIGTVGRLNSIKRYDILIKAFALFSKNRSNQKQINPKLCLIGNGPEKSSLEKLVNKLNIKELVLFAGEQKDVYKFYPLFDCFALSSPSEGLSIALLEALSFGLPIITTNATDKHDVITNGINGILVRINNEIDLAKAIENLYNNKLLISSMKIANLALAKSKFNIATTAKQYEHIYKQIYKTDFF